MKPCPICGSPFERFDDPEAKLCCECEEEEEAASQ